MKIGDTAIEGEFLMPRTQAALLLRSWHTPRRAYRDQVVELAWEDAEPLAKGATGRIDRRYLGTVRYTILASRDADADRISHEGAQVFGTFPPVDRLFPEEPVEGDTARQMSFNPELLADTRWLRSGIGALRFVFPTAAEKGKFQPVLVVNTEGTARGLVQPNLLLDARGYGA